MMSDKKLENLEAVAKSLQENLNLTELNLLSFNDELKKILVKNLSKSTTTPNQLSSSPEQIAQLLKVLMDIQADYARFKTGIGILLAFILP